MVKKVWTSIPFIALAPGRYFRITYKEPHVKIAGTHHNMLSVKTKGNMAVVLEKGLEAGTLLHLEDNDLVNTLLTQRDIMAYRYE
tara:strand:+ start:237 stop:491 length:255 start_codon:yes stop_codon:yes gene_type:complete